MPESGGGGASWRWVYPLMLATMVVVASGRGQVAAPDIVNIDKAVHFAVFGLLATLVIRAPGIAGGWVAVLVVSLFGIGDEWRQSFTPGRQVEFADWVADTLGAIVAVTAYQGWSAYRRLLEWPLERVWRRGGGQACPVSGGASLSAPKVDQPTA